mmetsp:Transcript_3752/g.5527  ORF Transcript_3752/g.5527 Transcript_3752/m.5527 type:complete len:338 (-) Transcript_3752:347-1360(-)
MSDRMFEHQLAGMTPPAAAAPPPPPAAAPSAVRSPSTSRQRIQTPQSEDDKLRIFLTMLQRRDDSQAHVLTAPTVPTSLSRRILQRQGVAYLDSTVATLVSASADRFLHSLLLQVKQSRDQRLLQQNTVLLHNGQSHKQTTRRKRRFLYKDTSEEQHPQTRKIMRLKHQFMNDTLIQAELNKKNALLIDPQQQQQQQQPPPPPPNNDQTSIHEELPNDNHSFSDQESSQAEQEQDVWDATQHLGSTVGLTDIAQPIEHLGFGTLNGKIGLGPIEIEVEVEAETETELIPVETKPQPENGNLVPLSMNGNGAATTNGSDDPFSDIFPLDNMDGHNQQI